MILDEPLLHYLGNKTLFVGGYMFLLWYLSVMKHSVVVDELKLL